MAPKEPAPTPSSGSGGVASLATTVPAPAAAAADDKKAPKVKPVPYRELFRYATPLDLALNGLAMVCAAFAGTIMPLFSILFGDILAAINTGAPGVVVPPGYDPLATFEAAVNTTALRFVLLGIGTFVATWIANALPMYTSERQLAVIRRKYMRALLRQDAAWFDTNRSGEAATRMAEETLVRIGCNTAWGMGCVSLPDRSRYRERSQAATSTCSASSLRFTQGD